MLTAATVKTRAREAGADLVGIASMDRFEGAPPQMDPRAMMPGARSMIVMGFRHFRGVFRGIEEGTFFAAYSAMGYSSINFIHMPLVLRQVSRLLEDEGDDALPIPNNFPWTHTDTTGNDPAATGRVRPDRSASVDGVKPAPDVFPHLRIAAFCAGLGEIGYNKMFLTPEFGPRQRLGAILTTAALEPDPLYPGGLCDRCMACVKACSATAIPADRTVTIRLAGRDVEWAEIDMKRCSTGFCGGSPSHNPFAVTDADRAGFGQAVGAAQRYKLPPLYVYSRALEGASGCIRACMLHLEAQGKLTNRFASPFRKRKPWTDPTAPAP